MRLSNSFLVGTILILLATNVYAFRISRPQTFSLPWTQDQINSLNDTLQALWQLNLGEYNLDVVVSPKNNADNGDIWFITTGATTRIQYKANGQIFTVDPQ